jgi:streptogramin lyase
LPNILNQQWIRALVLCLGALTSLCWAGASWAQNVQNIFINYSLADNFIVGNIGTVSATSSAGLPVTLTSTNNAVCTLSGTTVTGVSPGTCNIAMTQAGNSSNYPATGAFNFAVLPGNPLTSQVITINAPAQLALGAGSTVSASVTSGLPLTLSADPGGTVCSLAGGNVTTSARGPCAVFARQAGSALYGATTAVANIAIGSGFAPRTLVIDMYTPPSLAVGATAYVTASSNTGQPITMSSATPSICTMSHLVLKGVSAGVCVVHAIQAAGGSYTAQQADATVIVTAASGITPQTGFWWNPAEGGRGFVIEVQGNQMYMAGFLYSASGEATWVASFGPMTSSSQYSGSLANFSGGQTLTGSFKPATQTANSPGTIAITFSDNTHGTLTWPGGTIPIQRFDFGPGGASGPAVANIPTGWWWNPNEGGRGYAIEVQGNVMYFASYMYDANGNPTWYLATGELRDQSGAVYAGDGSDIASFYFGSWIQYANGQTLTGSYRAPVVVSGVSFSNTLETGTAESFGPNLRLTLPNNRQIPLVRFDFGMAAPNTATLFNTQTGAVNIISGPDGNLWFTTGGSGIGRITPAGVVTVFTTGFKAGSATIGITVGPDGALWFTENYTDRIGRITTAGVVTEFSTGITPGSQPQDIALGADGNLWFTEYLGNRIGRITPQGVVTEFRLGAGSVAAPTGITAGPDGNVWFVESYITGDFLARSGGMIGKITPAGVITEYDAGFYWGANGDSHVITAGPDGALWFTQINNPVLGRITTNGALSAFKLGPGTDTAAAATGITAGPDGNIWVAMEFGSRVAKVTPAGVVTEYSAGITPGAYLYGITAGPDGNIWFTDSSTGTIGRIPTH